MPALPSLRCSGSRHLAFIMLIALQGACTALKTRPAQQAEIDPEFLQTLEIRIDEHEKMAAQQLSAGELASASAHLHVLTLLAPEESRYRIQLESLRLRIDKRVAEQLATGKAAFSRGDLNSRRGDWDAAHAAMLEVLALDPANTEAPRILREIERQRISARQADRAARFKAPSNTAAAKMEKAAEETKNSAQTYELEQALELFRAGDTERGLREMQRYATNYQGDRLGRERLSSIVFARATALVGQGKREPALTLMERAMALRGATMPTWAAQMQALRKTLGSDYYEQAWRAYRTNIPLAIKLWETSLRFDPQNANSALKLREAKRIQESLRRIDKK